MGSNERNGMPASLPLHWMVIVGIAVAVALAGCQREPATRPEQSDAIQAAPVARPPSRTVDAATMDADQLRKSAEAALRESRLLAPAGNNALEYYLALRDKQPENRASASAVTDMLPMTVIGAEQAIAREDFDDARRLVALIARADPQAPSLPRLNRNIALGQQAVAARTAEQSQIDDAAAKRLAEQTQARERAQLEQQAAELLAKQRAANADATRREAEQHEAERRVAEQKATEERAARQREEADAAARVKAANELRPIKTPVPRYPFAAEQSGLTGRVVVEFTVALNGSVTAARVVTAEPPGVFDDAALAAVMRWQFQPVPVSVTTQRAIRFNLEQ